MSQKYQTERILIDPQRLMILKKQRKPLKMVPSSFQPPPQQQQQTQKKKYQSINGLESMGIDFISQHVSPPTKLSSDVPNVQFIASLVPSKQIGQLYSFQQGDYIPWQTQDRWLLVEGQIQVTGKNGYSFQIGSGYIFFLSKQTKRKVKQVVSITTSKLARIPSGSVEQYVRNYMFIKNSQKIKYLKYCPFLIWNDQLCQDLALCMQMVQIQKDEVIYRQNQQADEIYFVKQGIILLQRNMAVKNQVVRDYQMHYERDQANQNDVLLVARKGMVFGIDGVLLKQKTQGSSFRRYKSRKTSYDLSSQIKQSAASVQNRQKTGQNRQNTEKSLEDKNTKQIKQELTEENKVSQEIYKTEEQNKQENHRETSQEKYQKQQKNIQQILKINKNLQFQQQEAPIKVIKAKKSLEEKQKQQFKQNQKLQSINNINQQGQKDPHKSDSRIYTAKTMGKCQIFKLKKSVLSTFFNIKDMLKIPQKKKQFSSKQLDRICQQYTHLLLHGKGLQRSRVTKSLKNMQFAFKSIKPPQINPQKIEKVENIKAFEKKVKRISVQNAARPRAQQKYQIKINKKINENPFKTYSQSKIPTNIFHPTTHLKKYSNFDKIKGQSQKQSLNLPILNKKDIQKAILQVKKQSSLLLKSKQIYEYKNFKRNIQKAILDKQSNIQRSAIQGLNKKSEHDKNQDTSPAFIQIKSYRSIINLI